jgi:hypothetical protein
MFDDSVKLIMPFLAQLTLWTIADAQTKVDRLCKLDARYRHSAWMLCEHQPKAPNCWEFHRRRSDPSQYAKALTLRMYQLQLCSLESTT